MAPGSNERHPPPPPAHTGTIPKTKVRNCVVPQEAVTPTRRDINSTNLVSQTSLDWVQVPVSEYNSGSNYPQSSRKTTNNSSDHDFSDLDNSISLETALQRLVPVRPLPRGLPLPMQSSSEHSDDSLHHYHQPNTNGVSPHANHAAAAVMIVNPTTPNTLTGNASQPYNIPANANRNNLARAFHSARNGPDSNNVQASQHAATATARSGTKANNINTNLYEARPSSGHRVDPSTGGGAGERAESVGEALVSACVDPASVERRLGQIREYIRVTSSLVDTMRNSEDEAYIEHTKEEYDELVEMGMKLRESETKLMNILDGSEPENNEILSDTEEGTIESDRPKSTNPFMDDAKHEVLLAENTETVSTDDSLRNLIPDYDLNVVTSEVSQPSIPTENKPKLNTEITLTLVKKVTNIENEQLNKSNDKIHHIEPLTAFDEDSTTENEKVANENTDSLTAHLENQQGLENEIVKSQTDGSISIQDSETDQMTDTDEDLRSKTDEELNELLRQNIISCNEKLATIEVLKNAKNKEEGCDRGAERTIKFCKLLDHLALGGAPELATNMSHLHTNYHESAVRPMSVQSNGSGYSDNELWQNELKAKMEVSQQRLASLQDQQKRLLKYQAEAKQQLAEMHNMSRSRQSAESLHTVDNAHPHAQQNQLFAPTQQSSRMYSSNQIGVATTLPHTTNSIHHHLPEQQNVPSVPEPYRVVSSSQHLEISHGLAMSHHQEPHHQEPHHQERFTVRNNNMLPQTECESAHGSEDEAEPPEALSPHGRELQHKLRDLQRKKQHMENLVAEFQKLQAAELLLGEGSSAPGTGAAAHNTYSSDDSGAEDDSPHHKCNKLDGNIKNGDPFKLMEISAIKAALQKTKDLMLTVERYEPQEQSLHDASFQLPTHSNINDNKSEGGGSAGEWSLEGGVCRSIRNAIQPTGKITNHTNHSQPHHAHSGGGSGGSGTHEASISSLQLLAQQLRQEAENISTERQRLKHSLSRNKEGGAKLSQKKVNAELGRGSVAGTSRASPGPLERKQAVLRAELAEKQRQLQMILNKEKEMSSSGDVQKMKADSCSYSAMNQSYNSEQEEAESRADEMFTHAHTQPEHLHYRSEEGSVYGESTLSALPPHMQPAASSYCSDSDNGSHGKGGQRSARSRRNRTTPPERTPHQNHPAGVSSAGSRSGSALAEPRTDLPPPAPPHPLHSQPDESSSSTPSYPTQLAPPPPAWTNKSNQDVRSNQFTQNSYSQTMERLLGSQQLPFPPSVPFNMMMPYGMVGGTACGCSWWGPWCWQQLAAQQREIHQLREQLNNLEERWRAETAPHALNNQVPPGNRANNYWDNFRSYSRQNLLSANSKTNADGHLGSVPPHNPHPLMERSHNALHPASVPSASVPAPTPPANTPKRNSNGVWRHNISYETQNSLPSAPDVLNVNQHVDTDATRANINRDTSLPERNLHRAEPIPEIIQAHSSNLNRSPDSVNTKKKSSSKLPAKNSANRRNYSLDFVQNSNINIASSSEVPNLNLASTSRDNSQDKATSKLFDLLRENVYSEVTALISANELHPDFLIQLFRDLQRVSSDSMRQHTLQSIRDLLSRSAGNEMNTASSDTASGEAAAADRSRQSTSEDISSANTHIDAAVRDGTSIVFRDIVDFMIARGEEICSPDVLEAFKALIVESHRDAGQSIHYSQKKLQELLSKYEGMRLREVSGDIIEDLIAVQSAGEQEGWQESDVSESSVLQDVAGALNVFTSSDSHLHQINTNTYEAWGGDPSAEREREGRFEGKVDLIECVEMYNGDLAEADQTCPGDESAATADTADLLPDVVETEEATPTEAEAGWLGLDRVPTRLHMDDSSANQKD